MQKIFTLTFIVLILSCKVEAQSLLKSFHLGEENNLYKVSDDNPTSNSIIDILILGDTVWLGTSRGVSLSTDRGDSWTNFYDTPTFGTESISTIAHNKYTGIIWVCTNHTFELEGQTIFEGSGLKYTTDGGQSWESIPQPVDNDGDSLLVYGINDGIHLPKVRALPITVTPQNVVWQMDFTPNTIWIATYAGGIRKSTDLGKTWQRVLLPADFLDSLAPTDTVRFSLQPKKGKFGNEEYLNHIGYSIVTVGDSTIYAGTAGGINKSTDNGISWRKFNHSNQSSPISGNWIFPITYNSYDNIIWASTRKTLGETEFNAISASLDAGETWQTFLKGEVVNGFGFKLNEVIALGSGGAYRTNNKGFTWILPNSIFDEQSKLAITTDFFYSAASQGNEIWLGSADGLARITETSGIMWDGKWKVYIASRPLESKDEVYVFPNPYSPKVDENLKFKYTTEGVIKDVTIRIYDFSMNYVRTIIQNAPRNISNEVENATWDGKDDTGNIVSNGVYFYRIEIAGKDPLYGKIIVMQ
jgi:photosystem II stability/assembly factor-like uncharacterized protein